MQEQSPEKLIKNLLKLTNIITNMVNDMIDDKQKLIDKIQETLSNNESNFHTDNDNDKIKENPYAAGVHDGLCDALSILGIDLDAIDEGFYN